MRLIRFILIFSLLFTFERDAYATHAAGMDIEYEVLTTDTTWTGDYQVVISTQNWGSECSWDITDASGNILAQGGGYNDYSTYVINLCIPAGDLVFNWYDSYGDGWHGGSYSVLDNFGNVLTSGSPSFGSGGYSAFTSSGSGCNFTINTYPPNTYKVTLKFYRDCSGIPAPASVDLTYSSSCDNGFIILNMLGGAVDINPNCTTYCNGGSAFGIEEYIYVGTVTLTSCSDWVLGACINARNGSINTVYNPGSEDLCVEATLNNSTATNNSPTFTEYPTPFICAGQLFCYNNGTIEPDGDLLVYELVTPLGTTGPVNYIPPYSATNPVGGGSVFDVNNGNLCVTPPSAINGILAIKVSEYRQGVLVGSIIRDIQVTVFSCTAVNPPELSGIDISSSVDINDATTYTAQICPDGIQSLNFDINTINSNPPANTDALVDMSWNNSIAGATFTVANNNTMNPVGTFNWTPTLADTLGSPYFFTVSLINYACPAPGAMSFTYEVIVDASSDLIASAVINNPTCFGYSDGSIDINVSGTASPFSYLWDDSSAQTTQTATGLVSGTYSCEIADANGCFSDESFTLTAPPLLTATTSHSDNMCDSLSEVGNNMGTASVTVSGGTPFTLGYPYTYLWDNGLTDSSLTGLSSGSYSCLITDSNGCSLAIPPIIVSEPASLIITTSSANISCFGCNDGSITVSGGGGTPLPGGEYHFILQDSTGNTITSGFYTSATFSSLSVGTYIVNMFDGLLCQTIDTVIITQPVLEVSNTIVVDSILCYGDPGGIEITVNQLTPPQFYSCVVGSYISGTSIFISSASTNQTNGAQVNISGLYGDIDYVIRLVDSVVYYTANPFGNGSSTSGIIDEYGPLVLYQPSQIVTNDSSIATTCFGGSDGSAIVTPSGGTPFTVGSPYTYLWSDALLQTDSVATDLSPGSYDCIVTDSNGCSLNTSVTIVEPSEIVLVTSYTDISCFGADDGSAIVTLSGGTPPYAYMWSDPLAQTDSAATDLSPGSYDCVVGDSNGCTSTILIATSSLVVINEPLPFMLSADSTSVSCSGCNDGTITVAVSGGSGGPYTYSLFDSLYLPLSQQISVDSTFVFSGLSAGAYFLEAWDQNGCLNGISVVVGEPDVLSIYSVLISQPILCYGDPGGIEININQTSLPTVYSCVVGSYISGTSTFISSASTNQTNGAQVNISGLYGDIDYVIRLVDSVVYYTANPFGNGSSTSGIIDEYGPLVISQPSQIVTNDSSTATTCFGGSDGSAIVTPSGGTPFTVGSPYTYLWSDALLQTDSVATDLSPGSYDCIVTDSNGCSLNTSVTIVEPSEIVLVTSYTDISCFGADDGSAIVTPSGGNPFTLGSPYTYLWSDALLQTDSIAVGLSSGSYSCIVTDSNGCQSTSIVEIDEPTEMVADTSHTDITCFGLNNGTATVNVSGGIPFTSGASYTYLWDDPLAQTTQNATGLSPGIYTCTVVDSNLCVLTTPSIVVLEPTELTIDTILADNITCNGYNDGNATVVNPSGGTPFMGGDYWYLWNDSLSQTTSTAIDLLPGTYNCTITDSYGCILITPSVSIIEPDLISASLSGFAPLCHGGFGMAAIASVTGGTPSLAGYTYLWNDSLSQVSAFATDLYAGTYTCTVTDSNLCSITESITITEPLELLVDTAHNSVSCNGFNDGSATVIPTGGTPPYTYQWNDPGIQLTPTATGLFAGLYSCTVGDANMCTVSKTIPVTEPAVLSVNFTTTDISCPGGADGAVAITINGGTPTYLINAFGYSIPLAGNIFNTPVGAPIPAGVYPYTVTDSQGCILYDTINFIDPSPIVVTVVDTACGSFLFGSNILDSSGTYVETFLSSNSCDSIVTLELIIFEDSSVTYITECDSAFWNGSWYYDDTVVTTTGLITTNTFEDQISSCNSGKESNFWYFGDNAGIDFNSGNAIPLSNSAMNADEGCASISDINGNLLFYTDGSQVFDSQHNPMPNGFGLNGNSSSTQSAVVVKQPSSSSLYYIFTVDENYSNFGALGLCYSVVDMNLNGGFGDVINKNTFMYAPTAEKVIAVKHQNCSDYWIVTQTTSSDYVTYQLTSSGVVNIASPIISSGVGGTTASMPMAGYLKANADGSRIANALYQDFCFDVWNFDNTTGVLSNPMTFTWGNNNKTYGLEFSPSGDLLYVSAPYEEKIYQYNLLAGSQTNIENTKQQIVASPLSYGGSLQLAPDNKIYFAKSGSTTLGLISDPNSVGSACNYTSSGFVLASGTTSNWGLPTLYNSITNYTPNGCDSVATAIITINESTSTYSNIIACDDYTWPVNGVSYPTSGLYIATSINNNGCTHVDSLNLLVYSPTVGTSQDTACDIYTWEGQTLTSSGDLVHTYVGGNSLGCDSTHTLSVTIINSNDGLSIDTACEYYIWDGNTYTSSGLYTMTYTNVQGCDSIHTLDLTINNAITDSSYVTDCDYYMWNGQMITSSGTYSQTFASSLGCDSIHTLEVSISYSDFVVDSVGEYCEPYTWIDGITYTSSNNSATYTLTNIHGCDSIITLDLVIHQDIVVNAVITDELCFNEADGSIVLSVSGGLGAFSYSWNGPSFSSVTKDIFGLTAGVYDLVISDDITSCSYDTSFSINAGFDIQISHTINHASCYGTADGIIDITPLNLISPFYNWSDITASLEDRSNMVAGVYYLEIQDNNCFRIDTFVVNQPDSLFLIASQTYSVCEGDSSGEISVDVYGGTQDTSGLLYDYYWSNFINTNINSNLSSGIYALTVVDQNLCELKDTFEIESYTIDVIVLLEPPSCNGYSNGSIELEVSGGYPNYSYSWSNGSITQDLYNLMANTFTCQIVDTLGCSVDTTILLSEPEELAANSVINNIACYGENTGSVNLSISGGTLPYNLDWGNIDTNNLFAGTYFYEITDSNGCVLNDSIIVTQEDSLEVSFVITDAECHGTPTGAIEVIIGINTGTPPYYYEWDGPDPFYLEGFGAEDISGLFAGIYQLTLTDGNNCEHYVELVVDEPTSINQNILFERSSYSGVNISCKGLSDGWIEAQVSGGYLPYYFYWSTGYEGYDADSLTGLPAGTYTCLITDGIGCEVTNTLVMSEPEDDLSVVSTITTDYNGYDVSCYNSSDGAIDLDVTGGTGTYTYNWSDLSLSSDSATSVPAGVYGVIVYDSNNCNTEDSISLNAPDELILDLLIFSDTCSRGVGAVDLEVNGGVPNFVYLWDSGQTTGDVFDLFGGNNNILVTDANNCDVMSPVYIDDLASPLPEFNTFPDHRRYYEQLSDPIVFIDMTECYWQQVSTWDWDFGDGTFGSDSVTTHVYEEQGEFTVILTITTESNCVDTISHKVLIDEYDIFIPNAFTPGSSDDINNEFKAYGYGVVNYRMNIYTRWGERVFETEDFSQGWDGTHYLNGNDCIAGIYAYYIEVENIYGEVFKYENHIKLIR